MRQPPAHAPRRRATALATALVALGLATAVPAAAHDVLIGTDPADGAVLDAPPSQVVLTFSAQQAEVGAEVLVTGPDGASVSAGAAVVAGTTVTQPLAADLPDGAYAVTWRSVAADGHPVTGSFAFTLDAPDAPAPAPDPTDEPTEEPSQAATEPEPSATPTEAAPMVTGTAPAEGDEGVAWGWFAAGAALLAAVGAGVVLARRSRRG